MAEMLGVSASEAVAVVVSAIGIAVTILVILRLLGQRAVARMSTFDVAVLLVLGSVGGRVITGTSPTLAAGVIGLVTLALLRTASDHLARSRAGSFLVHDRPILLVDGDRILEKNLRRARISESELFEALRAAGIRNLSEIAMVALEGTGAVSVVKSGAPLDPRIRLGDH